MSLDLDVVSRIMYEREGEVQPGDEAKVARYESKLFDWKRDVLVGRAGNQPTAEDMSHEMTQLQSNLNGYWCEGDKCGCKRTHWVINESETNCWDCMHDPCACNPPLVWDEEEKAYYSFFLSCDGKTKRNLWMSKPKGTLATINYRRDERKRKDRMEKEREEEFCAENQEKAQMSGYCCHQHAKVAKKAHKDSKTKMKKQESQIKKVVDGPDHCIHCDEDPCVFIQNESRLCENDQIYFDEDQYAKDPVSCNSGRRKRAYQYVAYVLWEGISYRKPHHKCVEDGVRALFPPFHGKIMGYKSS
jgi:hypothetical protein